MNQVHKSSNTVVIVILHVNLPTLTFGTADVADVADVADASVCGTRVFSFFGADL